VEIYEEYSVSRRAIVASVVHAIVIQAALIFSSYNTPIYEVQKPYSVDGTGLRVQLAVLSVAVVSSMLLYLYTGIPNIFVKGCEECEETTNAGEVWCDNCGRIHGTEGIGLQTAWFVGGYAVVSNASMYPLIIYAERISFLENHTPPIHLTLSIVFNYLLVAVTCLVFLIVSASIGWLVSAFWSSTTGGGW